MAIFRRKHEPSPGDLSRILLQGQDMIEQTADVHAAQWGLGSAERWEFDGATGTLRWHFTDSVAEAPAQVLGTYNESTGSWRWAWSNQSLPEHLRKGSEAVRDWGQAHAQPALTAPKLEGITSEQADELAAIGFRLTECTGFYRAPSNGPTVYMTFGKVTIAGADGTSRTVDLSVE